MRMKFEDENEYQELVLLTATGIASGSVGQTDKSNESIARDSVDIAKSIIERVSRLVCPTELID